MQASTRVGRWAGLGPQRCRYKGGGPSDPHGRRMEPSPRTMAPWRTSEDPSSSRGHRRLPPTALNPTGTGSSRPSPPVLPPQTPRLIPLHPGEYPPPCTVVPSPLLAAPLPSSRVWFARPRACPVAATRVSGSWFCREIGGARCGAAVCLFSSVDGEARDPGVEFPVPCS